MVGQRAILSPGAAQQPEDQREEDAEEDRRCEREIDLGAATAAAPVQVSGQAPERETEARGEHHHSAEDDEDKTEAEDCFA